MYQSKLKRDNFIALKYKYKSKHKRRRQFSIRWIFFSVETRRKKNTEKQIFTGICDGVIVTKPNMHSTYTPHICGLHTLQWCKTLIYDYDFMVNLQTLYYFFYNCLNNIIILFFCVFVDWFCVVCTNVKIRFCLKPSFCANEKRK